MNDYDWDWDYFEPVAFDANEHGDDCDCEDCASEILTEDSGCDDGQSDGD